MNEVPRVLFLGICLDFYYCLWRVLLPKFGFHLDRGSVSQALVEFSLVPPGHPFERGDFHVDHVGPRAGMDQFVWLSAGSGKASVLIESDSAHPTNPPGVNVGDKRGVHEAFLRTHIRKCQPPTVCSGAGL